VGEGGRAGGVLLILLVFCVDIFPPDVGVALDAVYVCDGVLAC
jgi:hypothetical protein